MRKIASLVLLSCVGLSAHAVLSAERPSDLNAETAVQVAQLGTAIPSRIGSAQRSGSGDSSEEKDRITELPASDLAGLRYFAQTGDETRLRKEIQRLKALYPHWTPPRDIGSIPSSADPELDRMWQLFAQGAYPALRKAIDRRKQDEPEWMPPADMLEKLAAAEARSRLINASQLEQHELVVRIAAENASFLTCDNVEILWRLAEAFAKLENNKRALDAYFYVLKNCDNPSERISTIRKAIDLLPEDDVDRLVAEERQRANDQKAPATVQDDLARVTISRSLKNGIPLATADLRTVETLADTGKSDKDALLLGWYFLDQNDPSGARSWFSKAWLRNASEEAAQGLGLALIGLGKPMSAEQKLRPWWKGSHKARASYLAAASAILTREPGQNIDALAFETIVAAVTSARDADVARQIGWYAYNLGQVPTASQWFQVALHWAPESEDSAYGYALTLQKLGESDKLKAFTAGWAGRSEQVASVKAAQQARVVRAGLPVGRAERASPAGRFNCLTGSPRSSVGAQAALSSGWCLLNKNRPLEAVKAFSVALATGGDGVRSDAAYGQSLAYLRLGLLGKAAVSSSQARLPEERARELKLDLLAKRAGAAFEAGRYSEALIFLDERSAYAPERTDLMTLRGYSYARARRYEDALKVFEALAAAGSKEGSKGIATVSRMRKADLQNED